MRQYGGSVFDADSRVDPRRFTSKLLKLILLA